MVHWLRHMVLMLALAGLFCSCSQVEDARRVVAEADSLRATGMAYDDSLAIAKAAATLSHVRSLYPTDYAHANYYYGRLLRNRGDQPAAMLAFLNVIHSRTKDYAIKGRSYCNMGIMCGLAVEHELAYDMYEHSAEEFLKAQDSIAYFYALIDMAFELAEQKRKDESISLTNQIENECTDYYVLTKIWETRADAYIQAEMYDSAIYCVRTLQSRGNQEPTGFLYAAQAYDNLGIRDSALYYANRVLECSDFYGDLYNTLYILTHNDSTINVEEVLSLTSDRADIQMDYTEIRAGLSQAVQLLEQDLNRKPNMAWLWATIVTLLIIGVPSSVYISRKRKKHQLYSQKATAAQEEHRILSEQNQKLEQQQTQRQQEAMAEIDIFCRSITEENIKQKLCWKDFDQMCAIVNQRMFGFVDKLKARGITSMNEIRICVLLALGSFDAKQMANLVPCTYDSFKTTKSFAAKKLNISGRNMRPALLKLAIH